MSATDLPFSTLPDRKMQEAQSNAFIIPGLASDHEDALASDFVTDRYFDRGRKKSAQSSESASTVSSASLDTADVLDEIAHEGQQEFDWIWPRETAVAALTWIIMLFPMLVVINSAFPEPPLPLIYHWDFMQGWSFFYYCLIILAICTFIILLGSTVFLLKNNFNERHVYALHATYDPGKAASRIALMEEVYTERFGPASLRHQLQAITVKPDQNFSDHFINNRFAEKGLSL